jgi:hypothetical protein
LKFQTSIGGLFLGFVLAPLLFPGAPARAMSLNDEADTYRKISQMDLVKAYSESLAADGESTTGNLFAFNIRGCSPKDSPGRPLYIHTVQDRGQPHGSNYPTFVFTTGTRPDRPTLTFKTFAGKRIYLSETISCEQSGCLLSAKKGFSDIGLSDAFGNAAPQLPGLRNDVWKDLMGWFGF